MNATDTQGSIAALSRAGKQPQAIDAANAALAVPALGKAERVALLDLRAEALIAEGRFDDAARDAEAMLALAGSASALKVMALTRQALVLMRRSDNKGALAVAEQAEALAVRANDAALHRHSLLCLAEAQLRAVRPDAALATAERAAELFDAAGDTVHLGRAHWIMAFAHTRRSDNEASRRAAQRALELARQCGDGYGLANALNVLSFSCQDVAERLVLLQQAATGLRTRGPCLRPHAGGGQPVADLRRAGAVAPRLSAGRAVHRLGRSHGRRAEPGTGSRRGAVLEAAARRTGRGARALAGL